MNRTFNHCLITGITGSGGSYLAEHIIKKKKTLKFQDFTDLKGTNIFLKSKYGKKISLIKLDLTNYSQIKKD